MALSQREILELARKPEGEKLAVNVNHNKVTSFFFSSSVLPLTVDKITLQPEVKIVEPLEERSRSNGH